ncbi:hypothetical protein Ct61P_09608 [Colletotrichum tofieldiae]|nr:hypothetical protein Ct61P_09608 [Colletotrichum tofieldiae]
MHFSSSAETPGAATGWGLGQYPKCMAPVFWRVVYMYEAEKYLGLATLAVACFIVEKRYGGLVASRWVPGEAFSTVHRG